MSQNLIRNFSIIAHIDHGKSTLADRLIQFCGGMSEREMEAQVLDSMDLEKERGITIKAQTAALTYRAQDGQTYRLNLIDTPGHVDFSYEVSRSLSACEGALLVVDASQGVEAQTVANCYTAIDLGVEVIPVLNKIDLPAADPDRVAEEIEDIVGLDASDAVRASAKTGIGIPEILEVVVKQVPPPRGDEAAPLKALIIDSWFDNYLGVVSLVRVMQGEIKPRDKLLVMSTGRVHEVGEVGVFTPKRLAKDKLGAGLPARVSVSPTGAPCTSLIEALIQPTSPAPSLSSFLRLGVNTPTSPTSWVRPVYITSSLSPGLISPCMMRTSDTTPR